MRPNAWVLIVVGAAVSGAFASTFGLSWWESSLVVAPISGVWAVIYGADL